MISVRVWLALAAIGAILAALVLAAPADAAPDQQVDNYAAYNAGPICHTLDAYPTLPGVDGVLKGIASDTGFGAYDTGRVIALAVSNYCPRHIALLRRYAATLSSGPAAIA